MFKIYLEMIKKKIISKVLCMKFLLQIVTWKVGTHPFLIKIDINIAHFFLHFFATVISLCNRVQKVSFCIKSCWASVDAKCTVNELKKVQNGQKKICIYLSKAKWVFLVWTWPYSISRSSMVKLTYFIKLDKNDTEEVTMLV